METSLLSIDLGSGSGRAIIVANNGKNFSVKEVYRFPNEVITDNGRLSWDADALFGYIKNGIRKAFEENKDIKSIGIDSWGCDYTWIDKDGAILQNPRSYREEIPQSVIDKVHSIISPADLYQIGGNAYFNFNSIYQIYYDIHVDKILEKGGVHFLQTPCLFYYLLTGQRVWEYTIASTTALLDARKRDWSNEIFEKLDLPKNIKGDITFPGRKKDILKKEICEELGIKNAPYVSLAAGHDSASAVICLNLNEKTAYLLNGTWCLFGMEIKEPITNKEGVVKGLVNEGSFDGRIRYMKMFLGTWLIRALKDDFEKLGKNYSYNDLEKMAALSGEDGFVDIDDDFIFPKSMMELFKERYKNKYGKVIEDENNIVRLAYNTLGNLYSLAVSELEENTSNSIENIILAGGGVKDELLLKIIKTCTQRNVDIGFAEASALGNAMVQLYALGITSDLDELRKSMIIK